MSRKGIVAEYNVVAQSEHVVSPLEFGDVVYTAAGDDKPADGMVRITLADAPGTLTYYVPDEAIAWESERKNA